MSHPIDLIAKRVIATLQSDTEDKIKVLSLCDAITYVAWGTLVGAPKLRRWIDFSYIQSEKLSAFNAGVEQGAIRTIERAIRDGRLRPVVVWPEDEKESALDGSIRHALFAADQSNFTKGIRIFEGEYFEYELEFIADGYVYPSTLFKFLWDEVYQLVDPACEDPELQVANMEDVSPILSPREQYSDRVRRSGRRPKQHGAPIAAFLAASLALGFNRVAAEKDEELGRRLIKEYERLGQRPAPDIRNAAADARGAISTWINATSQS